MEEIVVPYRLALALNNIGFNGYCFAAYINDTKTLHSFYIRNGVSYFDHEPIYLTNGYIPAPSWDQVFDWFDVRFKLASHTDLKSKNHLGSNYYYKIVNHAGFIAESTTVIADNYGSKLEAKIACLEKLIKFVS